MTLETAERHSRSGEEVVISAVDANEQERRIHAAIARRAYELFVNRGTGAHEQEDWRQAESALLRPLCLGRMSLDDSLWLSMDAAHFEEGTIGIWVAPKRLTICGKPRSKGHAIPHAANSLQMQEEMMFREVALPVEVDPSKVTAKFNGQSLEILLKKARPARGETAKAAAA